MRKRYCLHACASCRSLSCFLGNIAWLPNMEGSTTLSLVSLSVVWSTTKCVDLLLLFIPSPSPTTPHPLPYTIKPFLARSFLLTHFLLYFSFCLSFVTHSPTHSLTHLLTQVSGGRHIALVHAGADLLVRTVWAPKSWALRVSVQ